jgi:hypothetical protein
MKRYGKFFASGIAMAVIVGGVSRYFALELPFVARAAGALIISCIAAGLFLGGER